MSKIDPRFLEIAKELLPRPCNCFPFKDEGHKKKCPASRRLVLALALQEQYQAGWNALLKKNMDHLEVYLAGKEQP